jgi:hypothetical protein
VRALHVYYPKALTRKPPTQMIPDRRPDSSSSPSNLNIDDWHMDRLT